MATLGNTYVQIEITDSDGRSRTPEFRADDSPITVDPALVTAVQAFIDDVSRGDGTSQYMLAGAITSVRYVIEITPDDVSLPVVADVGNQWGLTFPTDTRISLAARNPAGPLTTTESRGELADKTNANVIAFFDRLVNPFNDPTTPGLGVLDTDGTTPTLGALSIRAKISGRVRPRV